jgi:cytoplasmic iron level regulating protein YaaA (DUF328/UPF0246 family)
MNTEKAINTDLYTKPEFMKEASMIMKELTKYSPPEMESLMKINSELAEENFMRHISWSEEHDLSNAKQALLSYNGAVYQGLNAASLNEQQLSFANDHVRILSGLYGALRPLDLIMPYRLEMATKLKVASSNDLYSFWRERLTAYFKEELDKQNDNVLIDLASKEYSSAIDMNKLNAKVITPVFKDYKRGAHKVITIYAKRARGLISRFIIENNIVLPEDLKEFNEEGYCFNEYMSNTVQWVFTR